MEVMPKYSELSEREYWAAVATVVFALYMLLYVLTPTTHVSSWETLWAAFRGTFFGIIVGWLFVRERRKIEFS